LIFIKTSADHKKKWQGPRRYGPHCGLAPQWHRNGNAMAPPDDADGLTKNNRLTEELLFNC